MHHIGLAEASIHLYSLGQNQRISQNIRTIREMLQWHQDPKEDPEVDREI